MEVPSSPKEVAAKPIQPQLIESSGPKGSSTPKDSGTPRASVRQEAKEPVPNVNGSAETNGHHEKSVDSIQDNKVRVTLERGGRGIKYCFVFLFVCFVCDIIAH